MNCRRKKWMFHLVIGIFATALDTFCWWVRKRWFRWQNKFYGYVRWARISLALLAERSSDTFCCSQEWNSISDKMNNFGSNDHVVYIPKISLLRAKGERSDYVKVKELCSGGFGCVTLEKNLLDGQLYAFKSIQKTCKPEDSNKQKRSVLAECTALQICSGYPFVIDYFGIAHTWSHYILVLEYALHGDLWTYVKHNGRLNESDGRFYLAEIILGLQYIHRNLFVHRDLKLKNIVLDAQGHAKIIDFGLARSIEGGRRLKGFAGTVSYMAPEMIQMCFYGHSVDLFALGVSAFCMLTGWNPFKSKGTESLGRKKTTNIQKAILEVNPYYPEYLSPGAKDFLNGLLVKNPEERLGCPDILDGQMQVRNHEFFSDICWEKVENKAYQTPLLRSRETGESDQWKVRKCERPIIRNQITVWGNSI